jgi:hypothetical protein
MKKHCLLTLLLGLMVTCVVAQPLGGYYNKIDQLCGAELKSALHDIINPHTKIYYGNLFVSSGDVNLSQYAGMTVYLAFKYTSTTAGAATWEIKNVMVTGSGKLNKETDGINDVELASTPLTAHSSISYPTGIYTITGQRISVPVRSGLPHGVNIINGKKVFVNK